MPHLKFPKANLLLHPSTIAVLTWSMVTVLYALHLSKLLLYGAGDVFRAFLLIVLPVLAVSITYETLRSLAKKKDQKVSYVASRAPEIEVMRNRLRSGLILWLVCALIETAVSGGVPLIWILTGSSKVNFDYGIPSVHGMVNALLLALGVAYLALYLCTGHRKFVWFPLFAILWSLILVSRGTLLVLLLEYTVIFLRLRPIQFSLLVKIVAGALIVIIIFGIVGDFRSGADAFKTLAQPTEAFPEWAPSGLLWAYIYTTTPLNNLLLTMHVKKPAYNFLFPATAATLFPSVLRNLIYGEELAQKTQAGELQNEALTVSTAYVGPYQDMGQFGMIGFSITAALLCQIYWRKSGFGNIFAQAVFTQALVLSLFYNLLFSLPILGQLVWFYYFSRSTKRSLQMKATPTQQVSPIYG